MRLYPFAASHGAVLFFMDISLRLCAYGAYGFALRLCANGAYGFAVGLLARQRRAAARLYSLNTPATFIVLSGGVGNNTPRPIRLQDEYNYAAFVLGTQDLPMTTLVWANTTKASLRFERIKMSDHCSLA